MRRKAHWTTAPMNTTTVSPARPGRPAMRRIRSRCTDSATNTSPARNGGDAGQRHSELGPVGEIRHEPAVRPRLHPRRQGMPRCDSRCTRSGAWVMNASTRTPKFSLVTHQPGAAVRLPRRVPRRSRVRAARDRRRRVDRCSARASPPRRRPGCGCALPQPDAADPRARALGLTAVLSHKPELFDGAGSSFRARCITCRGGSHERPATGRRAARSPDC